MKKLVYGVCLLSSIRFFPDTVWYELCNYMNGCGIVTLLLNSSKLSKCKQDTKVGTVFTIVVTHANHHMPRLYITHLESSCESMY